MALEFERAGEMELHVPIRKREEMMMNAMPEPMQGHQLPRQDRRPQAFPADRIVAEPDRHKRTVSPKIIDVPMWPDPGATVVGQSGRYPVLALAS